MADNISPVLLETFQLSSHFVFALLLVVPYKKWHKHFITPIFNSGDN